MGLEADQIPAGKGGKGREEGEPAGEGTEPAVRPPALFLLSNPALLSLSPPVLGRSHDGPPGRSSQLCPVESALRPEGGRGLPGARNLVLGPSPSALGSFIHASPALSGIAGATAAAGSWLVWADVFVSPKLHMLHPDPRREGIRMWGPFR